MVRWRIPTHSLVLAAILLSPALVDAQVGRVLSAPGSAATGDSLGSLGRELSTPRLTPLPSGTIGPDPSDPMSGWSLDVSAITSLPVSIGVEAQVETPIGVFANLSFGHAPSAYLEAVDGILHGAGVYDDEIAALIGEATGNGAWNARLGIGLRPIEGLELSFGYTYMHASAALTQVTVERATGQRIHGMTEVPLSIDAHALHGRIGYRLLIEEHLVLRAAIGWTHSVATSARVDVPAAVRERPNDPATQIEDAVSEGFGSYGFTPELLVAVGYRF